MVDGLLANVGIGIVSLLCLSSLAKSVPKLYPVELILVLFVVRTGEVLDDDLGVNQTWKIDYKKRSSNSSVLEFPATEK